MLKKRSRVLLVHILLIILLLVVVVFTWAPRSAQAMPRTSLFPYVQGTQIIDPSGQPLVLRGAHIASSFANMNTWQRKNDVTTRLNSAVFNAMVAWHMNALRLPISNWIYNAYPTQYLSLLDQVVQQANQAGLYVILNLHDDQQSGSPYGSGAQVPKPESQAFWQFIASHYLNNPMVMYDVYNEPAYPDGNTWMNGGGTITGSTGLSTSIVGMQALVDTIRATGSQQIIIIAGVSVAGSWRINDPDIVYTLHDYNQVASGTSSSWVAQWGNFLGQYPLYMGEWALLPNAQYPYQCQGATPANADQQVINFMNFMDQYAINWTAWEFDTYHLIQDYTSFTPTRLDDPNNTWVCGNTTSTAGMGTLVKDHLLSLYLNGGSLGMSANFSGASGGVTLDGQNQTIGYTVAITVSDTRASAAGWHFTIASTQFSTSGPNQHKLGPKAAQVAGVTAVCSAGSFCTTVINNINYPLTIPAGSKVSPVSFYQAIPYSGVGSFTISPTINLLVPGNTYAGNYTSTITLAIISGP